MSPSFLIWLDHNSDKFQTYTIDEIAQLAIACGFGREEIAQWQTREKFRGASEIERWKGAL